MKYKLTPKEKEELQKLKEEIQKEQHRLAWQRLEEAEKKMLEKKEWKNDLAEYRRELYLDKYLVSLRYTGRKSKRPWGEDLD